MGLYFKFEFGGVFDMCKYIPNEESAVKRLRRKILYSATLRGKNKFLLDSMCG